METMGDLSSVRATSAGKIDGRFDPFSPTRVHGEVRMMRIRPGAPRAEEELEARRPRDELVTLARAAAGGSSDAVRTLIMSVTPAILRTVRGVMGTAHPDVEDVAQESVWRLVNALPGFRYECGVLHFACKVAVHTALNARRRERRRGGGRVDALEPEDHAHPGRRRARSSRARRGARACASCSRRCRQRRRRRS